MRLSDLIDAVPAVRPARDSDSADFEITAVTDDSRRAGPGVVFVARAGTKADGTAFLGDAIARGASAVLVRPGIDVPAGPAVLVADEPAVAGAQLVEELAGAPSRALSVCAVTGTNGKTTIAFLVRQLCNAAGVKCGVVGTVLTDDGATAAPATLTTPTAWELSPLLGRMVANGCRAAAIEASSHALHQGRLAGVRVAVGIFTNLTGDHLDYHGSMEAYADAKAMLFAGLDAEPGGGLHGGATAIVNADDPHAERMLRDCRARVVRCSLRPEHFGDRLDDLAKGSSTVVAEVLESGAWGSRLAIRGRGGLDSLEALDATVMIPLVGLHNAMNALQAMVGAIALGVPARTALSAIESVAAPPGRLERVGGGDTAPTVLVDYAHTDDALDSVLRALRPVVPAGRRLIVVFGCGGDRDRTKRPRMAAAACRHADLIIVTSDNPRTESPEAIIDEIMTGVTSESQPRGSGSGSDSSSMGHSTAGGTPAVWRDADRAAAIGKAIDAAERGDVVLIAGKGHEAEQIIGAERRPFDDRLVAAAALAQHASACR